MNKLRFFSYFAFVVGLLVFGALPVNQYEWMLAMEPTLKVEQLPEDDGGNRGIFTVIVLLTILACQGFVFFKAKTRGDKMVTLALCLLLVVAWFLQFGTL